MTRLSVLLLSSRTFRSVFPKGQQIVNVAPQAASLTSGDAA